MKHVDDGALLLVGKRDVPREVLATPVNGFGRCSIVASKRNGSKKRLTTRRL